MAKYNQLSRYGALSKILPFMNPGAKVHFVGLTTVAWWGEFLSSFGSDEDGGNRVFPSIVAALADSNVVASRGDVVLVLPGHTESVTGAATIAASKAGVQFIGIGTGALRPTITFTATDSTMTVAGAGVSFENILFNLAGIDAVVSAIVVTGADVTFRNCEFTISSGTAGCVLGILTAATAARLKILDCRFIGPATSSGTTTTACIKHEVGVDYVIKGCYFTGKMTQAILNATALLRGLIDDNRFVIATGTLAISVHASSTPFITNNRINVPSGTTPITAAAGFVAGNIYSAAAGVTSTGQTGSTATVSTL